MSLYQYCQLEVQFTLKKKKKWEYAYIIESI